MGALYTLAALGVLANGCFGTAFPTSRVCSEECIQYILSDAAGPKVLRLYKELLKPNTGLTSPVDVNGQVYQVSVIKRNLIENAIRRGVKETVIESMLDDAAIVSTGPASPSNSSGVSFI
ncbi:hypothetical protein BIW11_12037 [Tropilaelaps mercedesae]|uniref:Uncharacterized protein n=1 Tax=Tropilaelaps mercedesae TaxID=418985 RepID=A0A1V9X8E1_9ACAR|nr:hypothetical protein BIW11_12037 [Tropilaelaps mercedesae]